MIYDNNYNDNIILKREAFQNLLTNIKNYPIIDVDYVEEFETDNLHGNNIWKGFTHNTPCLKITYGDDSTTKGNSMFASVEQKKALFDYGRALKQLQIEKNNKEYEKTKLNIALQNNLNFLYQEQAYLDRILNKIDTITKKKETYLQAGLSVLLFPYAIVEKQDYFNFGDIWERDNNGGPLSNTGIDFTYVDLSLKYKDPENPNEQGVIVPLRYSKISNYLNLLSKLEVIKKSKSKINGIMYDNFDENEQNFYTSFINFIKAYNYLSFVEAFQIQGFTEEEVQNFQNDYQNNHKLTQETLTIIKQKLQEILEDKNWDWQENTYPDFQSMIINYSNNISNIVQKIIGRYEEIQLNSSNYHPNIYYIKDNNGYYQLDQSNNFSSNKQYYQLVDGIINNNIRRIEDQIAQLIGTPTSGVYTPITLTESLYLPHVYFINNNNTYSISDDAFDPDQNYYKFEGSIEYYNHRIEQLQQEIQSLNQTILNSNDGENKTVYGYKYIRLGTNIKFDNNYNRYLNLKSVSSNQSQASGTFRLSINDDSFEVPIKGFNGNISDEDIYILTQKQNNNNQIELGKINFLGNMFGKGSLITNSGHIYASQGSVIAGAYLALRSSVNRTDNVAGFRYDGSRHIIEAYDITGNAYKNGRYSNNIQDYILTYLPDSDTGQIYILDSPENVSGRYEEVILDNITYIPDTYYIETSSNNYRLDNSNQFNEEKTYYKFEKDYINYENRLTFSQAEQLETRIITEKDQHSLHFGVRLLDNTNFNAIFDNTKEETLLENGDTQEISFNKEKALQNQNKLILHVENKNELHIDCIHELEPYSRTVKIIHPKEILDTDFNNCANDINTLLEELEINLVLDINSNTHIINNLTDVSTALSNKRQTINELLESNNEEDPETEGEEQEETNPEEEQEILNTLLQKVNQAENKLQQYNELLDASNREPEISNLDNLGKWIALDFKLKDWSNPIKSSWNYYTVVDKDNTNASQAGLTTDHLVFWLNLNEYTEDIHITFDPVLPEGISIIPENSKIPTDFIIKYNGVTNAQQGEIGIYENTLKDLNPVIEPPKFYVYQVPDTEFIKFSTQQLYLSKQQVTATLKINPEDNYIEAYEVDDRYNDSLRLAGLRFKNAEVAGNIDIQGKLTMTGAASFNNGLTLRGSAQTGSIIPTSSGYFNLGSTDKRWDSIYSDYGEFDSISVDRITINGSNLLDYVPIASASGDSSHFWRGAVKNDAQGNKTLPGWSNQLDGDFILSKEAGPTGTRPTNAAPTDNGGAVFRCAGAGYFSRNLTANRIFNAVFNDYAECRQTIGLEPGRVVIDNDDGSLSCANQRLLPGGQVISDTYGHLMGEDEQHKTPLAVAGRVLVYPYQNRNKYHAGMAVCSAPNGTVDIMTREEIREYPDCIIGIVSEIPNYDNWGSGNVKVNGRIWIKIK